MGSLPEERHTSAARTVRLRLLGDRPGRVEAYVFN
jgi:hypothetical protein